ncbi:hypothetical protein NE237_026425 [Protea cynaroides]|uniref:Uncharacterized protein n=1 Tax=Protea cynaroides TaxID=273540 RepID=A0A9Q0K0G9_9MAGN|nr:hypothetical protein NE237_026425 [Protea cynaroides]
MLLTDHHLTFSFMRCHSQLFNPLHNSGLHFCCLSLSIQSHSLIHLSHQIPRSHSRPDIIKGPEEAQGVVQKEEKKESCLSASSLYLPLLFLLLCPTLSSSFAFVAQL